MVPYPAVAPGLLPRAMRSPASPQAKMIEGLVNPEVWVMFDTRLYSANAIPPDAAAYNFAQDVASTPFFSQRTLGNSSAAITSMTTNSGYVDFPYKAYGIGVEVWCDSDAASATGIATAPGFIETKVMYSSLTLQFATDYKLIAPLADLPAGGGIVYGPKVRTQAAAANSDSGSATNGLQTVQARAMWKDYILFRGQSTPFTCNIVTANNGGAANGALHRVQGLQALTGDLQAGVRVKFWGYRGKSLITGSPYRG
jgi:hypothetical protein